jgi:ABC-type polysaccharide/polyol phosphate export permease
MPSFVRSLVQEAQDIYKYRYVIMAFTQIKLKHRYRRSVLGYFWTVFTPLINYLIMGSVISMIARGHSVENYFFYFLSGSIYFGFQSNIISGAYTCLIHNENFIKKIYFPKSIFFMNIIALELINFFLSFVTLYVLAVLLGMMAPTINLPLALVSVILSLPFLLGVGIIVGIGAVYFRDLMHIIPSILQALYFLTPILYAPSMIPEKYQSYIYWNPLYYYIETFRAPLMHQTIPYRDYALMASGISIATFLFGFWLLKKMENKIVFKL